MSRIYLLAMLALLAGPACAATTYYVALAGTDTNPGTVALPFGTIQKGINTASAGDTILVGDGTYSGSSQTNLTISKDITLKSQGGAVNCILDCQSAGRGISLMLGVSPQCVMDGFTVKNGAVSFPTYGNVGGAMVIDSSSPTIRNCVLSANSATAAGGGLYISNGSPHLEDCTITGNSAAATTTSAAGGGVSINTGGSPTLIRCVINGNGVSAGGSGSTAGGGGVYVGAGATPTFTDCDISSNSIADNANPCTGGGVYLLNDATFIRCTVSTNTIAGTAGNAFGAGVDVVGGQLTFGNGVISDNRIADFIDNAEGGGIAIESSGAAVLNHSTVSGNRISRPLNVSGAALAFGAGASSSGSLVLADCTISGNTTDGSASTFGCGISQGAGTVTLTNTRILGNVANLSGGTCRGAGAGFVGGTATVVNCLFAANQAVTFLPSSAMSGAGAECRGSGVLTTFTNCTFASNSLHTPGQFTGPGGVLCASGANVGVANCVFRGNTGATYTSAGTAGGILNVSYSDVEGGVGGGATDGGHNITSDPMFVRPPLTNGTSDYGDLHLQGASPCINAGNAAAASLPAFDMDGYKRNQGGGPDMGAYEQGVANAYDFYIDTAAGSDGGSGISSSPFKTVAKAISLSDPLGRALLHVKQGNYTSDKPRIVGRVRTVNWNNTGRASIGKP